MEDCEEVGERRRGRLQRTIKADAGYFREPSNYRVGFRAISPKLPLLPDSRRPSTVPRFAVLIHPSVHLSLSLSFPSRISRAIFLFVGCTLDFDHRLATWDTMGDCQLLQTRKGRRVFDRSPDDRLGTPSSDFQALSHSVSLNER